MQRKVRGKIKEDIKDRNTQLIEEVVKNNKNMNVEDNNKHKMT